LIMVAWGLNRNNEDLVVAPKWLDTVHFDIVAKAPADVSVSGTDVDADTLLAMLRALLVDRFKLKYHNEDQPVNVYALLAPKKEPKMKKSDPASRSTCNRTQGNNAAGTPMMSLTCQNTTMAQLAERLPSTAPAYFDHPSIDLTGLEGGWDFVLNWTPR